MISGGQNLNKYTKQFLIIAFALGYLCFGIIIYSNTAFGEVFSNPLYLFLLVLGFLSPFLASLAVFVINKEELGGLSGLIGLYKPSKSPEAIVWVLVLLIVHYGFGILLNNVGKYGNLVDFFKYFPIMILLLGSQEIGWRKIVQPSFEKEKGFYKSIIITGLLWALWFLPLVFFRGFIVLPEFYSQFAAYLVGVSFLLTSMYRISNNIVHCAVLSGLIFALVPVIIFKQGFMLVGIAILEVMVASFFKNKNSIKNT